MSDGILKAVQAHVDGVTANAVLDYLSREFGMTVGRTISVLRCSATAVPAGSKIAVSAGTFRPQRKASSENNRHDRLIAGGGSGSGYGDWALPESLRDQPRLTKPFRQHELEEQ